MLVSSLLSSRHPPERLFQNMAVSENGHSLAPRMHASYPCSFTYRWLAGKKRIPSIYSPDVISSLIPY